ncbi:MAG: hypothetical protein Q8N96_03925 [Methylovulum sp.]|nr:hypothetical protein [Methylovulum sp.]
MLKELATKKPVSDLNVAMQTEGAGVVVLAHSMGGLVTRSAIEEYHAFGANAEKLRRLITLDTPHHGSPAANPSWAGYLVKDLHTQGSADIQWDNFDSLYTKTDVNSYKSTRWTTAMNSQVFDKAYLQACERAACPLVTQNPWLAYLNANFIPLMNTYQPKYLLYAGWMINVEGVDSSPSIINNGSMTVSDGLLRAAPNVGGASIPSGGAAPVSSALWYVHNPLDSKATPFPLNGSDNESAFFSACNLKSNWDETQWFGGYSSPITLSILIPDFYTHFVETCGNSILISKSDTLSASNPNHPLGFQVRIFWDYDHETMVNGAYWGQGVFSKKAGGWDKYIGKPPYIINGNTSGDSGFWGGVTNQWVSGLVRDNYIAKAVGYKQNNENLTWSFNSPANYNPLKLEPLFNVLQGDLMREANSQ